MTPYDDPDRYLEDDKDRAIDQIERYHAFGMPSSTILYARQLVENEKFPPQVVAFSMECLRHRTVSMWGKRSYFEGICRNQAERTLARARKAETDNNSTNRVLYRVHTQPMNQDYWDVSVAREEPVELDVTRIETIRVELIRPRDLT